MWNTQSTQMERNIKNRANDGNLITENAYLNRNFKEMQ